MLDINFYMEFDRLVSGLDENQEYSSDYIMGRLDSIRSQTPYVYNIETTNRCNMRCEMCPRTTMMTRANEDIDKQTFVSVVKQIRPHTSEEWERWKLFCSEKYGVYENDMSENHFFLYIIPKVIQLHGYGDPLLDRNMAEYVKILHDAGFLSYFSCNPANINMERTIEMIDSGLNYIKYSIESVNDEEHRKVRGGALNFAESYRRIEQIVQYKTEKKKNLTVVITMLDLNRAHQKEDYDRLLDAFKDLDVYIYLKSEDCQWYRKDFHGTKSIHWSEICKHPWMTMTIKSNGEATMCMEDYNNEIILGDANITSLLDIWNGGQYREFRLQHLRAKERIKCVDECDMKLFGDCYKVKEEWHEQMPRQTTFQKNKENRLPPPMRIGADDDVNSKGLRFNRECVFETTPPYPRNLLIGLTNICNHRCVFCEYRRTKRKSRVINQDLLVRLLREAYDLGTREVGFYLTAEPFINKNLEFAVATAHEIGYEYIYTTTNGALADSERMRFLFENGLNSVKYSVNAGNRESYQKTHGRDDFDKVIENIKLADKLRKEMGIEVSLYLSFVEYGGNTGQTESLKQLLGKAIDKYYIYPVYNIAGKAGKMAGEDEYQVYMASVNEQGDKCELLFNNAYITAEGFLTGCCYDFDNELVIADLKTISLAEAWNCENFQMLRKWHLEDALPKDCLCYNCVYGTNYSVEPLENIIRNPSHIENI